MNERIWELKRQAMLFAQEKCDGQTTDMHGNLRSNIWTEKFAELIVQECAEWIVDNADSMEHLGPAFFAKAMKTEFGVEE
jgi:hypothetical protein